MIFRYIKIIIIIFGVLLSCSKKTKNNGSEHWLTYEPSIVKLEGIIQKEQKYGPPNYGETPKQDKKICIYVLILKNAVNVRGNESNSINSGSFDDIKKIQLMSKLSLKDYIGREVTLKGTLFQVLTGYHYTDVLMNVAEITEHPEGKSNPETSEQTKKKNTVLENINTAPSILQNFDAKIDKAIKDNKLVAILFYPDGADTEVISDLKYHMSSALKNYIAEIFAIDQKGNASLWTKYNKTGDLLYLIYSNNQIIAQSTFVGTDIDILMEIKDKVKDKKKK